NADIEKPATQTNKGSGWYGVSLVAALTMIFLVLIIFPGFLAAELSRTGCVCLSGYGLGFPKGTQWNYTIGPKLTPVCEGLLYPSSVLMAHSDGICRFYIWQYRRIGGPEVITLSPRQHGPLLVGL
ncbi:MAG TPA: hypothetical protein VG733_05455, partial [Chthoniobacteraceae bacterium]|nr:hypothetical protein [Chthoniobacteraceae bacterium]